MHDAYTGLAEGSLHVTADFTLDGAQPGEDLAGRFKNTSPGIWEMKLSRPLRKLDKGLLRVSIKDHQGNTTAITRIFSVE